MEKITLQQGETVEINGAIIGVEIIEELLFLQFGIELSGSPKLDDDSGIEDRQKNYDDLTIFLASEAGNIDNHAELAAFFCSISYMKRAWNKFRIPKLQ